MKNIISIVLAFIIGIAIGYWVLPAPVAEAPEQHPAEEGIGSEDGTFCIQVITPARNPETGDIQEFPTPCDVPAGWEVIHNEIPGLELEVY